jgi:hypothetical protein
MKTTLLLVSLTILYGCGAPTISKQQVALVESGERVSLVKPVTIIETRPPFNLKLTWQLLPGNYVERYRISLGRVFESEGALAEFTPTMGDKQRSVGGFIVMNDQPGVVKLYLRSNGGGAPANYGFVGVAIAQAMLPGEGDLVLVADFDSSEIRRNSAGPLPFR